MVMFVRCSIVPYLLTFYLSLVGVFSENSEASEINKSSLGIQPNAYERQLEVDVPPTYVMPLGDSITQGSAVLGGYREMLYKKLIDLGYNPIFVGTKKKNCLDCKNNKARFYEAHGAQRLDFFYKNVVSWMETYPSNPDVILVLLGTTEFGKTADDKVNAINEFDKVIQRLVDVQPFARIIVSTLLERSAELDGDIQELFNPFVEDVVNKYSNAGHKVSFLDLRSKVPFETIEDRLHPNQEGYELMADAWAKSITFTRTPYGDYSKVEVLYAIAFTNNQVTVSFSKPILRGTKNNFSFLEDVTIFSVKIDFTRRKLLLQTSELSQDIVYHLKIKGINDRNLENPSKISATDLAFKYEPKVTDAPVIEPTNSPVATGKCVDKDGKFENASGLKRTCAALDQKVKLEKNCGGTGFTISELGKACPFTCRDYNNCLKNVKTLKPTPQISKSPTTVPTNAPDLTCKDVSNNFDFEGVQRNCKYFERKRQLCGKAKAATKCPITCKACPCENVEDRNNNIFVPLLDSKADCSFVELNSDFYCGINNWKLLRNNCQRICGSCLGPPTSAPSKLPTTKPPTPKPSYKPTNSPPSYKPTKSPQAKCTNSKEKFYSVEYGLKGCLHYDKAENLERKRLMCAKSWVRELCPETCETCKTTQPTPTPTRSPIDPTKPTPITPKPTKKPQQPVIKTPQPTRSPTDPTNTSQPTSSPTSVCADNAEKFYIGGKVNLYRYCSDFSYDSDKFCQYAVYYENCPETCGLCPSVPSPKPTPSPVKCADNKDTFYIGGKVNKYRYCKDFSYNTDRFCEFSVYFENCPDTCGLCPKNPVKCKDNEDKFFIPEPVKKYRYCEDFKYDPERFCQYKVYNENCPDTCGLCT
mmetsp:Transcript_18724/g.26379  ORF Transcript_18724/g.26379 Transcript_18724/m.26379 type:complete len:869 (-) Transcript_18724:239-2845(-)